MKKIAVFTQMTGGGGAERVATVLANELSKDYAVYYCAFIGNGFYPTSERVKKHVFPDKRGFALIKEVGSFLKKESFDTVLALGSPAATKVAVAKKLCGLKFRFIASERNDPKREITSPIKRLLRKWAYKKADKIVFQTDEARDYYPARIRDKGAIILNPVLIENESVVDIEGDYKRIVAAGRIDKQKNFPLLIRAFALFNKDFPEYTLDIFGKKNDEEEYQKVLGAIEENVLNEKVVFKGFTSGLYDEFLRSSVYVSSSDYEGISNSMLEAMAAGLPCVCTDCPCGGARATIKDGENGLLVPVGDEVALFKALKKAASDGELRKKLSLEAVKIRDRLSVDSIVGKWEELF